MTKFYNGKNGKANFVISFRNADDLKKDFGIFAKGYRKSASLLASDLLSRNHFADYDAYPVVFLYRHSLELRLKNIIYQGSVLISLRNRDEFNFNLRNTHNLVGLANDASNILKRLFPQDSDLHALISQFVKVSDEFSEIDPASYSYRYPITRSGQPSTNSHQIINLETFSATMDELLSNLEIVDFGFQVEIDNEFEKIILSIEEELQV